MTWLNDTLYLRERDELLAHLVDDGTISAEVSEMADDEQQAMSSERLVEMRQQIDLALAEPFCEGFTLREESDLLAEVERLRAREAALLAEREQAMAIVRAVAYERAFYISGTHAADSYCAFCDQPSEGGHAGGCEVIHARALLASEQEGGGDGG